jgi:hypothetical protein
MDSAEGPEWGSTDYIDAAVCMSHATSLNLPTIIRKCDAECVGSQLTITSKDDAPGVGSVDNGQYSLLFAVPAAMAFEPDENGTFV